jgi:hypothetical protein
MDLSLVDILLIVAIVILLAIIIVLNVLYFVDGRINKLMKSIDTKLDACDTSNTSNTNNTNNTNNTEGFSDNTGKFTIDTQPGKPIIYLQQGYSDSPSDGHPSTDANRIDSDGEFMYYPDHENVLRYGGKGCYRNIRTAKARKVKLTKPDFSRSCARLDAQIEGNNPMSHPKIRPQTHNYAMKLFDATGKEYPVMHKVHVPPTYMGVINGIRGNPTFKEDVRYFNGVSGSSLSFPADVDQIGSIPVNNYQGEPVPVGSAL